MAIIQPGGSGGGGGSVTAAEIEATFTATGLVYQGTGSGTGHQVLPPGYEIGYTQITSTVPITGTTSGSPTSLLAPGALTFDGAPVVVEVFAPYVSLPTVLLGVVDIGLYESGSLVSIMGEIRSNQTSTSDEVSICLRQRFTPSAGSHTYVIQGWTSTTTGSPSFAGGAGSSGGYAPAYVRFTKV